jgi:VWFA-related protein
VTRIPLIALGAAVLALEQPAQKQPDPPVFGVGVTLVAVPVFVTDRNGKSVAGLTADDFVVEDEGKPVPIAAFQAIDLDAPSEAGISGGETPSARANLPMAVQAAAARQFIVLIDSQFSPRAGLFFSQRMAAAYIRDRLAPGDLVAVATTGRGGLKIAANFSADHEYLARVIEGTSTAGTPSTDPLGFSSSGLSGGVGSMIADLPGSGGITAGLGGGRGDEQLVAQNALLAQATVLEGERNALGLLTDVEKLIEAVSALRGRKQLVLFSGGFPEGWLIDAPELLRKMDDIYRLASRSDVVIHTIDLLGLEPALDNLGVQSTSLGPRDVRVPPARGQNRGTLIPLSSNTGGRAIQPTGDYGVAFGEVDRISRQSYVIAFETPDADVEGSRPRKLKVRVHRPGLSVSHRGEYSAAAPTPASGSPVQMLAAEAISKGLSGGRLPLRLQTVPYRDRAGKTSVHAVLHVDGAALAEAAQGDTLVVQVYGYAMDGGRVLDGLALNTSIDLTRFGRAVRDSGISVLTAFPVSPGRVDLRFFASVGSANLTGSIQRDVAVPAFGSGERVLSTPLFMLAPEGRLVVPFQPKGRSAIQAPFYVAESRFIPETLVALTPGLARDVCVFVWRDRAGSPAPYNITGELVRAGREPHLIRIEGARVVPEADGFDRYIIPVVPPRVAPGPYRLRLNFVEPGTGRTTYTETEVQIEG